MRAGFSKTASAGMIGVCKTTFDNWTKEHPEFLAAVKRGETARTLKLEQDMLKAADGPTVTSRIFALKNAAPDEWRDKKTTELEGKIQTEEVGQGAAKVLAALDRISERASSADE